MDCLNPQTGTINIDEINLSPENAPNWTNNIIYVPQNPIMIDASIKENIVWGKKIFQMTILMKF